MSKFMQGRFRPKNPSKFKGDLNCCIFRSSWELKFMMDLDKDPDVIEWNSESQAVGYKSPKDGRFHRYFPDMIVKRKLKDGSIITQMIEIKPEVQILPPKAIQKGKQPTKSQINEIFTYAVNSAKWEAAQKFCDRKGYEFLVLNEYDIGIKKRK